MISLDMPLSRFTSLSPSTIAVSPQDMITLFKNIIEKQYTAHVQYAETIVEQDTWLDAEIIDGFMRHLFRTHIANNMVSLKPGIAPIFDSELLWRAAVETVEGQMQHFPEYAHLFPAESPLPSRSALLDCGDEAKLKQYEDEVNRRNEISLARREEAKRILNANGMSEDTLLPLFIQCVLDPNNSNLLAITQGNTNEPLMAIIFPIRKNNHYTVAILSFTNSNMLLYYYDSLGNSIPPNIKWAFECSGLRINANGEMYGFICEEFNSAEQLGRDNYNCCILVPLKAIDIINMISGNPYRLLSELSDNNYFKLMQRTRKHMVNELQKLGYKIRLGETLAPLSHLEKERLSNPLFNEDILTHILKFATPKDKLWVPAFRLVCQLWNRTSNRAGVELYNQKRKFRPHFGTFINKKNVAKNRAISEQQKEIKLLIKKSKSLHINFLFWLESLEYEIDNSEFQFLFNEHILDEVYMGIIKSMDPPDCSNCTLRRFPGQVIIRNPSLFTDLTTLDLSENMLLDLPSEIEQLQSLKTLNLSYNHFIKIPKALLKLTNLTKLYLGGNHLKKIPDDMPDNIYVVKDHLGREIYPSSKSQTLGVGQQSWITRKERLSLKQGLLIDVLKFNDVDDIEDEDPPTYSRDKRKLT